MRERHSSTKTLIILIVAAAIVLAVVLALTWDVIFKRIEKTVYQREYSEYVVKYAREFDVDENLVYAVIKAESDFDKDAVSPSGARGLMQIMPETYLGDICTALGTPADENALFDPETNIRAGTYYLSYLINHFGSVRSAVAAYNAGIGRAREWLGNKSLCDADGELMIDALPIAETRRYVATVEYNYAEYTALYPTTPPEKIPDEDKPDEKKPEPLYLAEGEVYLLAEKYGKRYGVDPCLILAVAKTESSFNAHALSNSNAMGLMQIKPSTYLGDIRPAIGSSIDENVLYDAETNVKSGAYYLSWLFSRLGGMREVVVAYNYGIGNVLRLLENEEYSTDGKTLIYDKIPNSSARSYLNAVMRYYEGYKVVYGEKIIENN